jgi:hypothetical protein
MPNPSILGPRGDDLKPSDSQTLLWNVYRLRRFGYKMERDEIIHTHRVGRLSIEPNDEGWALLHNRQGECVGALRYARVRRLTPGGGLLLVGCEMDGHTAIRQAWWCVLKLPAEAK